MADLAEANPPQATEPPSDPNEAPPAAAAPASGARSGGKGRVMTVAVLAGGIVVGAALGAFVVGPKLVRARAGGSLDAASAGAHGAAHGKSGAKAHRKPGFVLEYENLIINPSGSEGSHFLMATIGVELSDQKSYKELEERELRARDRIIEVLSSQTMEALSAPNAREVVKQQLAEELGSLAGDPEWIEIYLPQFVIQ